MASCFLVHSGSLFPVCGFTMLSVLSLATYFVPRSRGFSTSLPSSANFFLASTLACSFCASLLSPPGLGATWLSCFLSSACFLRFLARASSRWLPRLLRFHRKRHTEQHGQPPTHANTRAAPTLTTPTDEAATGHRAARARHECGGGAVLFHFHPGLHWRPAPRSLRPLYSTHVILQPLQEPRSSGALLMYLQRSSTGGARGRQEQCPSRW